MARYIGPKTKISRKFNDTIFGQKIKKKKYPPGQHGKTKRKKSEYALQLLEKQKLKYTYGLLEKSFFNLFKKAFKKKGITSEILINLLELRLDNIIFRLGLTNTRQAARQLILHKHIIVNNTIVNIPSYTLKINDLIKIKKKSKLLLTIKDKILKYKKKYTWLE